MNRNYRKCSYTISIRTPPSNERNKFIFTLTIYTAKCVCPIFL